MAPGSASRAFNPRFTSDNALYGNTERLLIQYLAAVGAEIVVTDGLLAGDPVARRAAEAGLVVWVAPCGLVSALAQVAAIPDPGRLAAVLARMPHVPLLRAQLRRFAAAVTDPRQVPLL